MRILFKYTVFKLQLVENLISELSFAVKGDHALEFAVIGLFVGLTIVPIIIFITRKIIRRKYNF